MIGVYVSGEIERILEELERWMGDREREVKVLIGGDFNARTAKEGGGVESEEDKKMRERVGRGSQRTLR